MENARKVWTIAYREMYSTFTQPSLILIMFVSPLMLATIISLAFGGGGGSTLQDIPVAIVNLDDGANGINNGQIFVSAFIPSAAEATGDVANLPTCDAAVSTSTSNSMQAGSLSELTTTVQLDDPAAARAGVDKGDYAAAIIIPPDFSQSVTYSPANTEIKPVPIEVYGDSGRTVSPGIIRSIVEGITNQIMTGQIAVAATLDTVTEQYGLLNLAQFASNEGFARSISCAFTPALNNINIEQQTVTGEEVEVNLLVALGAAQAVFFALFTANGGATSILEDRRNWTLQRMIVSPTPRVVILLGKLVGVYVTVLVQLVFLFIGFTLISSLLEGQLTFIWGTNWVGIIVLVLATALGAAGVGMVTAAVGKTAEQSQIIGSVISLLMGMLGGAFFQVQALGSLEFVTRLSIVRWGSEAFTKLASGQDDIWTNVFFLAVIGAILFVISLWAFNRRQDI